MGMYKYLKKILTQRSQEDKKKLLMELRRQPATMRLEHPSRLDRARSVGYKAKQGYFVVRQRVRRGGHERPHYRGGKTSRNLTSRLNLSVSYQVIAETRVARKYTNAEVLNSYYLAEDGQHKWYEVIMVDRTHPGILKDKAINWIANPSHKGRVFRGLTSAGRKSRGLRNKGKGAEKVRPSKSANAGRS